MAFRNLELERPEVINEDVPATRSALSGLGAALELGYLETPVASLMQMATLDEYKSGKIKSAKELNDEFPFLPEPFTAPEDTGRAQTIVSRYLDKMDLQRAIEEGPKDNLYGVATFAAQMLPHAIDPINVAAGMGVTALVGKTALAAKVAQMSGRAGTAAKIGLQATDMFVGNIPGEAVAQGVMDLQQQEGTMENVLVNSAFGAAFGVGINVGVSKLASIAKRRMELPGQVKFAENNMDMLVGKSPEVQKMVLSTSMKQMAEGRPPVVDTIFDRLLEETRNIPDTDYVHRPFSEQGIPEKLYMAIDEDGGVATSLPAGQDHFGFEYTYLTDNPHIANASAGSHFRASTGVVEEVSLKDAKLLDMDNPPEGMVLGDDIIQSIKDAGYDGFHYVVKDVDGISHTPHNAVVLLRKNFQKPGDDVFSGTMNAVHGTRDVELKAFKGVDTEIDSSVRYQDNVFGDKAAYFDETGDWSTTNGSYSPAAGGRGIGSKKTVGVNLSFEKALVLTPKNVLDVLKMIPEDVGNFEGMPKLVEKLKAQGYDGLIIRGFDELGEKIRQEYVSKYPELGYKYGTPEYEAVRWSESYMKQFAEMEAAIEKATGGKYSRDLQNQIISFAPDKSAKIVADFGTPKMEDVAGFLSENRGTPRQSPSLDTIRRAQADRNRVRAFTEEEAKTVREKANSEFLLTENARELPEIPAERVKSLEGDFEFVDKDIADRAKLLEQDEVLGPIFKAEMDELNIDAKNANNEYTTMKQAMSCLLGLVGVE